MTSIASPAQSGDAVGTKKNCVKNNLEPQQPVGAKADESPSANKKMKTALFTNFTDQEFIGYWDGKGKKFAPGQSVYMPSYLAAHFAKHLTNRELLRADASGNLIYKDGEKLTSPKNPEESPIFMGIYNKAYTPDDTEDIGSQKDDVDALIASANKNRAARGEAASLPQEVNTGKPSVKSSPSEQDPTQPQVILAPDDGEDDEDKFPKNN